MQGCNSSVFFVGKDSPNYYKEKAFNYRYPGVYTTLRYNHGYNNEYLIDKMNIHYSHHEDIPHLQEKLRLLPNGFLETLFEFGIEITTISQAEKDLQYVKYKNKQLYGSLQDLENIKKCGFYLKGARLVGVDPKILRDKERNPIIFYLAMAYQHAIVSYPNLINLPMHKISYSNKFRPSFVVNYALKYGEKYFSYCFFYYFSGGEKKSKLKEEDRIMYRFIELLLEMWKYKK